MGKKEPASSGVRLLTIEREKIPAQYAEIPLEKVRLSPDNPRLFKLRLQFPAPTPEQIQKFLLDEDGVADLQKQIRDHGGLVEPIIVDQDNKVIEGNCRTAIYMKLRDAKPQEEQWKRIPAYMLAAETTERQIAILQAIYHVHVNKIRWRAYEQQHHLQYMRTKLGLEPAMIARVLGLSEKHVRRLLEAYDAMTKHYVKAGVAEDRKVWSHFDELFKSNKLAEFRSGEGNVKLFAKLVKEKKIKKGADVRRLPAVVNDPKALQKLQTNGLEAALKEVAKGNPSAVLPHFKQLRKTIKLLEALKPEDLENIRKEAAAQRELRALYQVLVKVARMTGIDRLSWEQ